MKESAEYVRSIYEDLCWLGAEPTGGVFYGSDYFDKCYEFAVKLIKNGDAYVCDLSKEDLAEYRGNADDFSDKGTVSPYRSRSVDENPVSYTHLHRHTLMQSVLKRIIFLLVILRWTWRITTTSDMACERNSGIWELPQKQVKLLSSKLEKTGCRILLQHTT